MTIDEIKKKCSLKNIISEVLEKLNFNSIKNNEVILYYLTKDYIDSDKYVFGLNDFIYFKDYEGFNIDEQRMYYYNYVYNYFKDRLVFRENVNEATLTIKSLKYDNDSSFIVNDYYCKYLNELSDKNDEIDNINLNKKDFIYNKISKETECREFDSNIKLVNVNNNKVYKVNSTLVNKVYNSNLRTIEYNNINLENSFFKYDLIDISDFMPSESLFNKIISIKDDIRNPLVIVKEKNNGNIIEKYFEVPINYDIKMIDYYLGSSNENYENNLSSNNLIYRDDNDLFLRLYDYSTLDIKNIKCKKLTNKKNNQ